MGIKRFMANRIADVLAIAMRLGGEKTYRFFLDAIWERYPVSRDATDERDIRWFCPDSVTPDVTHRPLIERIFAAYEKASRDQQQAGAEYQPSSMWNNILRRSYAELTESLRENDLQRFHGFLSNFGSWSEPTAIEESQLIRQCATDRNKRRHLEQKIVSPLVRHWLQFESNGRDLSALVLPPHGNFGGALVNGRLISPGSVFSDIHARLIAGFLDAERPIFGELGGGFGRLLYFLSRYRPRFCYVGFDLPETLCCACYFLMRTFPEKRFLLYGEDDWDAESLQHFDFLLLPSFEISKLPDNSVDLFINENSLGEIEAMACRNYVREICRSAQAFWHRNHEHLRFTFADDTVSLLNHEYPIPKDKFVEVVRYADLGPHIRADRWDQNSDMYWYYYRLRNS